MDLIIRGVHYSVDEELHIPRELTEYPISPVLKQVCGFDPATPDETLQLAQVVVKAVLHEGQWVAVAVVLAGDTPDDTVRVGAMWCAPGTARDDVLKIVDQWIRQSTGAVFVPGPILEIPINDPVEAESAVNGAILVRGLL